MSDTDKESCHKAFEEGLSQMLREAFKAGRRFGRGNADFYTINPNPDFETWYERQFGESPSDSNQ